MTAASQHIDDPAPPRKRYAFRGPYKRSPLREAYYPTLSFGELTELRQLRRAKNISLNTIAHRLGISPEMLRRYQCGERRPPRWVLEAWRKELS